MSFKGFLHDLPSDNYDVKPKYKDKWDNLKHQLIIYELRFKSQLPSSLNIDKDVIISQLIEERIETVNDIMYIMQSIENMEEIKWKKSNL